MAYEAPALGTAAQVYTAAAHNIIVNDVLDHEARILKQGLVWLNTTTITAEASKTISSVFTSVYDNYLVKIHITSVSTQLSLTFQLTASGTPATSGYTANYWYHDGGASVEYLSDVSTGAILGPQTIAAFGICNLDLWGPNRTIGNKLFKSDNVTTSNTSHKSQGNLSSATQYDGLKIIANPGNMTGTVQIYGYTKA